MMIRRIALILVFSYLITGCSLFKPKMSDELKSQVLKVLDEGATLTAMTEQGVNYSDFGNQLAKTRGAYNLALSMWADDFAPEARINFDKAFEGWDLTLYLWNAKINELDNPVEPDINRFDDFVSYAAKEVVFQIYPYDFMVENYRAKRYLPFDENISILLSVASDYFQQGQTLIQQEMK